MREQTLSVLLCPKCRRHQLKPTAPTPVLAFGPIHCKTCHKAFPVAEFVADLLPEKDAPSSARRWLDTHVVARSFERFLRPALQLAISRHRLDHESEFLIYEGLLGHASGLVLDLGCGTGLLTRRLARLPGLTGVIGMDVSKAMLEEAVAQAREACVTIDFVLAQAPYLPFCDNSLGAVVQAGSLNVMQNLPLLFSEVNRVLKPGGVYIASSYEAPLAPMKWAHVSLGLHPRGESELRSLLLHAGMRHFERVSLSPMLFIKATK